MPKKQYNSFYFFMKELQSKEAAKGRSITMKNMPNYAHPMWKKMSIAEKEQYEVMAKKAKNDPNLRGVRLASDGTSIEDTLREEEEEEKRENYLKHCVRTFVFANLGLSFDEFKENNKKKIFYFISFNILCRTETDYIPNEIGLVEYSIEHGIHREYHRLIHPGTIPTGYTGDAKRLFEKHEIDIFGEKGSERDILRILRDIKSFIDSSGTEDYPPLFSMEDDIERTQGCLEWIARRTNDRATFSVWNAKYLLMELRDGVGHTFPSSIIAGDTLSRTCFDYDTDARCEFHDDRDVYYCALAYSKRLCFLLSDAVCDLFDVMLTERHMPTRAAEEKNYVVTVGPDSTLFNNSRIRRREPEAPLDTHQNYYQNQQRPTPVVQSAAAEQTPAPPRQPRQPATPCIAAQMMQLRLNPTSDFIPGHGIGRGLRRN